jgi:hypothetical protein
MYSSALSPRVKIISTEKAEELVVVLDLAFDSSKPEEGWPSKTHQVRRPRK